MKRILIVDDSSNILSRIEDLLNSMGHKVVGKAASGKEAIRQARELLPDLILMDIVMPGKIDGIQAAREVLREHDIPIIFLSDGTEDERLIDGGGDTGAYGYVFKPVERAELKATIELVFKRQQTENEYTMLFRDLIENISDLIYIADAQGTITFVNTAAVKNLGYSLEELAGKNVRDFATEDSYRFMEEKLKRQMNGQDVGTFEIHLFDKERNIRIFDVREHLIWKDGRIVEFHGIGRDITDRKIIENALKNSNELKRKVLETSAIGMAFAENRKITWANSAMERLFRFERREEYIGRDTRILYASEEEYARIGKLVYEGMQSGGVIETEARFIRKDSTEFIGLIRTDFVDPANPLHEIVVSITDVTEKMRAQEELRRSEEKYRKIFTNAGEGIYQSTPEGRFISANPAFARMLGYKSPEELIDTIIDIGKEVYVNPSDRETIKGLLDKDGIVENYETELWRKDGKKIWVSLTISIIEEQKGKAYHYEGIIEDITARKIAEDRIRESEQRNRYLVSAIPDLMFVITRDGAFVDFKADQDEELVIPRPQIVGKNVRDIGLSPEHLERAFTHIESAIVTNTVQEFEYDLMLSSGLTSWSARAVALSDSEVLLLARNITERKKTEEALADSELKYRSLVENAQEAIIVLQDEVVKFFNPAALDITGYSQEEMVSKPFVELVHPDDLETVTARYSREIGGENTTSPNIYRAVKKDGTIRWVSGIGIPIVWEERPASLSFITDITEKREAEQALRESEEKYRTILHTIEDGYFEVDVKGSFTSFNESMRKMLGYDQDEMLGLNYRRYMTKEIAEKVFQTFNEVFRTGIPARTADWRLIRKDGKTVDIETSISLRQNSSSVPIGFFGIARDISERKRAEQALRESEQRYRLLAENANDIIFTMDTDLRFTYISPSVERVRGFTVEEAMAQTPAEALTPDSLKVALDVIGEGMRIEQGPTDERIERQILELEETCKDGSTIWTETTFSVLRDNRNVFTGLLGITRDISERRRAEEAHRESEDRYHSLFANSIEAAYIVDLKGNLVEVNASCEEITGYSRDELIGMNFRNITDPENTEKVLKAYNLLFRTGQPIRDLTYNFIRKDGEERTIEAHVNTMSKGNQIVGFQGTFRDITERKRAEEALRESEAKFRNLFETSRDFMYISSLDGTILDSNLSARDCFGFSDEEIKTLNLLDVYYNPQDRMRLVEKLKAEGFVQNYELKLKKKDGSAIDALANIVVRRDSRGDIIGFQGSIKDITQMRRLEQQLMQAEKLSGLGTMISGVAHELNNPLTAIMGNAEILLMRKTMPEDSIKSLEVILRETERAGKIVNSLLTFARKHKQERSMIGINEIIMESYKLREYNLRVSNIDVELSLADDLPNTFADPYQLQQVFTNILNNAHDALSDRGGGTLIIRSKEQDHNLIIQYEDNGPGIDRENLKKIFDPFFTTKEVGKGTGLGLPMAYGIINEHGGKIEVESEPGKGAKFIVHIPIIRSWSRGKETIIDNTARKIGKRILVIDDEQYVTSILSTFLSEMGHIVRISSSGHEALALIREEHFDAIIMDIKMPGMEGKELFAHIINEFPDMGAKVLFMTGDTLNEDTQAFLSVTGNRHIAKPFRMEALIRMLDDTLNDEAP